MIINNLVTTLYSSELLSGDHKEYIDSLLTNKEKTEYFLDKVIKPGLEIKYTKQFDEMLRVLKTSDDCAIIYLVGEIQKFLSGLPSTGSSVPLVGEKQSTAKGN